MQASPRGGAPGCLSNPGSPVRAPLPLPLGGPGCHSNRAEWGVSSLRCRARISGPRGPLRTCGRLAFLGLSCCWGPEPRGLWARPALPPASRPVLEGPQLPLPDREAEAMMESQERTCSKAMQLVSGQDPPSPARTLFSPTLLSSLLQVQALWAASVGQFPWTWILWP